MKIFITERVKPLIEKFSAEESQQLFDDLRSYRDENPANYKDSCALLNSRSDLDIRVITDHPLFSEPFVKVDTKMIEHLKEEGPNKRMMAWFKAGHERDENLDEVLTPLEFD